MSQHTWKATVEDLEKIFDTIDLNVILPRALNYLSTKINCQNVVWVLADELRAVRESNGPYSPHPSMNRNVMLKAQSEMDSSLLIELIRGLPLGEDFYKEESCEAIEMLAIDGFVNFAIPLRDPSTHELLAVLVFYKLDIEDKYYFQTRTHQIATLMSRHLRFCIEHYQVQSLTVVDDVTDLYNQRMLTTILDKEISRSKRHNKSFTVLFLDVDYFKMVNDTRGHLVGSKVLIEIADVIKGLIRSSDFAFRYGGDEYVILLTETEVDRAEIVAERIRKKVEESSFNSGGPELNVTVSIGLASFPDHAKTREQVLELADQAMYYAKNKSRNVVYVTAS